MASPSDEILHDFPPFFKVYKDGRIERDNSFGGATAPHVPVGIDPVTGVQTKDVVVSPESGVSVRIFLPNLPHHSSSQKLPLLVHYHGGGFCIGSPFDVITHKFLTSLVTLTNAVIVSVDYRLAPENPLPIAYDDSLAALHWIASHSTGHGPEPWLNQYPDLNRVFLTGESAGANIAHHVAVRAGAAGLAGVKIIGLILLHPFFGTNEEDKMYKFMCPTSSGLDDDPNLNPGVDPDLGKIGCEKVLVCVAEKDGLKERGVKYYETLTKSGWGGHVDLIESEGEDHCFHLFNPNSERVGKKAVQRLKSEAVNNGVVIADRNDVTEGECGGVESFRTYKRRKHVKLNSESKAQEDCRAYIEAASHKASQAVKEPCNVAVGNTSDNYSHGHWGSVVLKHLYQSLGDDKGGIEGSMREALLRFPKISCATAVKETCKIDEDGQEYSSQFELMPHRLWREVNGHADVLHNGCSSELDGPDATEMCKRTLCNILVSEKFSSLCKVLIENFKGMKPESVFDFSVINSRLKERAYEQSPTLFLSDIQQVWRKLQDTGNEIVSLAKGLSNMSRTFYCEQAGVSVHSTFKDGKQEFCNQESDSHMKPEQTGDCGMYRISPCRHCGNKADGADSLVCDSCEEIYHVSCIEPPVKEIPHKNWYCAKCTASGIGSPHENCLVCERLNVPTTLNFDESFPINEETINELEENSNCTYDGAQASRRGKINSVCKICGNEVDGERIKICGHSFCSNKYYHVRCLTSKQLKSYGPCWYCPSCLCQVCLTDKDDDRIVLCDGCDHAYHIYCMKPPRTSIPEGKWFCRKCDTGIQAICRAKKAYESNKQRKKSQDGSKPTDKFEKKWKNKHGRELEKAGGMDMLLTAANSLNFEEDLAATQT